jgi:hypothetical protein
MASQPILRLLRSRASQIRSFTQTSPFLAARPSTRAVPPVPKFGLQPKSAPKPVPVRTSRPSTGTPPPPPPPHATQAQPPKSAPKPSASSTPQSYASGLLGDAKSVLLYKAPRNYALFASCFFTGSCIYYYSGSLANSAFIDYTAPTWAKGAVLIGCMLTSAIASAVFITPHHLVKSISIARTAEKEVVLRVKGTRFSPFMKPAVFDVAPGDLMIDSNVAMTLEESGEWMTVPLKNVKSWTEGGLQRPDAIKGNAFQRLNQRMLNIGPAIFSHTRKMFNREGMAYLRIGSSNWKMDLSKCEILENGSVLMKLVREGAVKTNLADMAIRKAFGK